MTLSIGAALVGTMLLNACAAAITDCPAPAKIDKETQARILAEMDRLPEGSPLIGVLASYLDDRDKMRACRSIRR